MKDEKICRAYDTIGPDQQVQERILAAIEEKVEFSAARPSGRRLLLIAAAVALLASLAAGGYAAYQAWRLPEPQGYELDPENGVYSVQTEAVYQREALETTQPQEDQTLDDGDFMAQAVRVLEAIGLTDVDTSVMRVVRQENLAYGREEARVYFENDLVNTSVKFDASFGHLLSITSIDWVDDGQTTDRSPEELAQYYYENLPVQQGYTRMEEPERYDEQYWSYSFCREVEPGLYSYYEMVRISVNPMSGRLVGCNVFYFPLLDDHGQGDVPLTQEEAEDAAWSVEALDLSGYTLESAQVEVVLPNWMFTEYMDGNLQYSDVSRLAWVLRYCNEASEFADEKWIYIDCYTGELLGGDTTG